MTADHPPAARTHNYTWKMTARPENGVGPAVERAGALTVIRPAEPRDHDSNGDPDVQTYDLATATGNIAGAPGGDPHERDPGRCP
ncbi:hypothetical protein ACFQ69_16315 [Streptomyces sp. NPDC056470]|uniref:hypothetical protein n=1 Tax=unclassified Streptomyces TaxID=2593676 RepID=UPI0036B9BB89